MNLLISRIATSTGTLKTLIRMIQLIYSQHKVSRLIASKVTSHIAGHTQFIWRYGRIYFLMRMLALSRW